ncbi:hypothetical protein CXB38_17045 [Pseudomonas syringae]|uniref:TniQ family protein n=1 Tax=Pseudomonas syringae TaxID=317 RepID=UPI000CDB6812|nr:hypothetical protein CXB38_17045 [Pseudomonas syringae]
MGTSYAWHSRIDVINSRWPRAQSLMADELLSSWLIRSAFAHGCSPMSLTGSLWPGWRCWTIDLDRGLTAGQVEPLARLSGVSVADICTSTLHPIAQILSPGLDSKKGVWPWILALGRRNRRSTGGLQICPICLSEQIPYYRIWSRLAWHTCCEKHLVRLIDSCPRCGAPLQPHLLEQGASNLYRCDRCNTSLSSALDDLGFTPGALAFQLAGDNALRGMQHDDTGPCEASGWFYRARFVSGVLRVGATTGSKTFAAFREAFNLGEMARPLSGLPIEMLPVVERMNLFSAVWKIMDMGESKIRETIRACAFSRRSVVLPAGEVTFSIQAMLDELAPGAARPHKPVAISTPTPRRRVENMWARLKRKVLRDG